MQKNSIKKTLPRLIKIMMLALIVLILPVNVWFQLYLKHERQQESSQQIFGQIEQTMEINDKDLKEEKEEFSKLCIQRADMAAYFVKYYPDVISDLEQTRELAGKLDVDEIHFFTRDGEIYAGTHPEYYGYTFYSGEQMMFFAPMLEDTDLKLCQEITPNTAEGKEMQYAAVWLEDKSGIVQIGMRPERLLKEMKDKSLAQIVSAIPFDVQGYFHIVDMDKHEIIASTQKKMVGLDISGEEKLRDSIIPAPNMHAVFGGERYCIYTDHYKNYLLIRTYVSSYILHDVILSTILLLAYILLVAIGVVGIIAWYVERRISNNLILITRELKKIEEGNLESIALSTGIQEFDELIFYINQLLKSIHLSWGRLSKLIDRSQIPLGILEYNKFYKKFFINEWMINILDIKNDKSVHQEELRKNILNKLKQAESRCVDPKENVYEYSRNGETVYLRIETFSDEQSLTYYIMDVSLWWQEINVLRKESNRDILTGLYNRRGLNDKLHELFADPEALSCGAVIMLDADGLKRINDIYGHYMGDEYLKAIGSVLQSAEKDHSVCARLGGDEFVVFLYGYESYDQADAAISTIESCRGKGFMQERMKKDEKVEFSMGHAYYPAEGTDHHFLMSLADERMYQDKRKRKQSLEEQRKDKIKK